MAQYFGQPPVDLDVPEPPQYFGPSAMMMKPAEGGGISYLVTCWMGGKGLAEDGRWGKTFNFSFDSKSSIKPEIAAAVLLDNYRATIEATFGEESAKALIRAICLTLSPHGPLVDEWTAKELEDLYV